MKEHFEHDQYDDHCWCRRCQPGLNSVFDKRDEYEAALRSVDSYLDEFSVGACDEPRTADVTAVPAAVRDAMDTMRTRLAELRKRNKELQAEVSAHAKACGEEMAQREYYEKNWNSIIANNKDLYNRAVDSDAKRTELLKDLSAVISKHTK